MRGISGPVRRRFSGVGAAAPARRCRGTERGVFDLPGEADELVERVIRPVHGAVVVGAGVDDDVAVGPPRVVAFLGRAAAPHKLH